MNKVQGIIFDMDNTLLQSRIDFTLMKQQVFAILNSKKLLPTNIIIERQTVATMIELAKKNLYYTEDVECAIWEVVCALEKEGMQGVELEPYAEKVVADLHATNYLLAVLTNNSKDSAEQALKRTGIAKYFTEIVGREQMKALKPSPSGLEYIKSRYIEIPEHGWLMVGDSWIDGQAALASNTAFLAYQANAESLTSRNIPYIANIHCLQAVKSLIDS